MKFLSQINVNTEYTLPFVDGNNGQVLTTDGQGAVYWGSVSAGATSLDGLTDVEITSPQAGQILNYSVPVGGTVPVWRNITSPYATIASPTFTGIPAAPTAPTATNTTQIATTAFVKAQGYLTSYTETDPTVPSHVKSITTTNISNWNTAYNDSIRSATFNTADGVLTLVQQDLGTVTVDLDGRYLTSFSESDPVFEASAAASITSEDIAFWDTAYGWGNHADYGYLTSLPVHSHTIADVTGLQTALDGKVPTTRTLTINGTSYDLSANRSWTITTADSTKVSKSGESHDTVQPNNLGAGDGGFYTVANGYGPSGGNDALIHIPYSNSDWAHQLAFDWALGNNQDMWFRTKNNGTWQGWRKVWHDGNFTDNSANWNTAYNDRITSAAVTGTSTKTLTLTQGDGGTVTATWTDYDTDNDAQVLTWTAPSKELEISNGNSITLDGLATEDYVLSQGFITGESDTLATVTGRGASTATAVNFTSAGAAVNLTGLGSYITFKDEANVWVGYVGFEGNTGRLDFPGRNVKIVSGWNGTIELNTGASGYNSGRIHIPYGYLSVDNNYVSATAFHGQSIKVGSAGSTPTTDYGIFHQSGVGLGIVSAAGGTTQGISFWSHNGSSYFESVRIAGGNGNVGIATTTPQKRLDVNGSGIVASFGGVIGTGDFAGIHFGYSETVYGNDSYKKSAIVFERTDNHGQGSNASGRIHFLLNNISGASATSLSHSVVTIDTDASATQGSARVGIGTTSPSTALHVNGVITATGGTSTNWNAAYNDRITAVAVSGTGTKTLTLTQQDGGTLTATWTDYDTDNDAQTISYSSGTNELSISNGNSITLDGLATEDYVLSQGFTTFQPWNSGTGSINYTAGNVGVGTATPTHRLTVSRTTEAAAYQININNEGGISNGNFTGIRFSQDANGATELGNIKLHYYSTGATDLSFGTRYDTQAIYIKNGGNVGINRTSPSYKLDVAGNARFDNELYVGGVWSSSYGPRDSNGNINFVDWSSNVIARINRLSGIASVGNRKLSMGILDINSNGSPEVRINTKIPFALGGADFTVNIKGFQYGSSNMVSLSIGWHYYLSQFYNETAISNGAFSPTITLGVDENNYVVIHLSNVGYWPKLYVESVYSSAYADDYVANWNWVDAGVDGLSNTTTVPYKPLDTSITGNAAYATNAGNSATTSQTNFSTLTVSNNTVATQAWVTSQGYLSGAHTHSASDITSGTLSTDRLPKQELGISIQGNFGQWEPHGAYTNLNTDVAYWGWSFVQGNTNAPHSGSQQWYRGRFSLGDAYGNGSAGGDYWMEIAIPRYNQGSNSGNLFVRTCENGTINGWQGVRAAFATDADTLDGQHGSYYQPASTAITTSNIGSQSVSYASSAGNSDALDGVDSSRFVYGQSGNRRGTNLISNWNQTDFPDVAFLSAESGGTNAPTGDYTYGTQYSFHRDGAAYRTQLVTALYSDTSIYVRNSRDSDVWNSWKRLWHSGDFSSTNVSNWNTAYGWGNHAGLYLPIGGGNATGWVSFSSSTQGTPIIKAVQQDSSSGYYLFQGITGSSEVFRVDRLGNLVLGGAITAVGYNKGNWDTAYGWGNHADAPYWNVSLNQDVQVEAQNVTFAGNVIIQGTLTENSSIRFKENIQPLEPALAKVEQLNPVTYTKITSREEEIGLIAEEVAELFPEVVTYNEAGQPQGIQYQRLSVILLKAVQELTERVNKLENK